VHGQGADRLRAAFANEFQRGEEEQLVPVAGPPILPPGVWTRRGVGATPFRLLKKSLAFIHSWR
jgi:hypothetical protein